MNATSGLMCFTANMEVEPPGHYYDRKLLLLLLLVQVSSALGAAPSQSVSRDPDWHLRGVETGRTRPTEWMTSSWSRKEQ